MSYLVQSNVEGYGVSFSVENEDYLLSPMGKPGDNVVVSEVNEQINRLEQADLVTVFNQGNNSGPIVDVNMRTDPQLVTAGELISFDGSGSVRLRVFIKGNGGPQTNPLIPDGQNESDELWLFACDDTDTVDLTTSGNVFVSGDWHGSNGSLIYFQWDNVSKWVEGNRNEI